MLTGDPEKGSVNTASQTKKPWSSSNMVTSVLGRSCGNAKMIIKQVNRPSTTTESNRGTFTVSKTITQDYQKPSQQNCLCLTENPKFFWTSVPHQPVKTRTKPNCFPSLLRRDALQVFKNFNPA